MLNRIIRTVLRPSLRTVLRPFIIFAAMFFYAGTLICASPVIRASPGIAETPSQNFGIRPATEGIGYFEHTLAPGEEIHDALFVSNLSDAMISLDVWVAPGKTMAAGGITFGDEPTAPVQWVTIPEAGVVDLHPRTSQTMTFTVTVPLGTPPGEYVVGFLAARAEAPAVPPPSSGGGIGVIVVTRAAIAMIITVPQENQCEADITSLTSASRDGLWQLGIGIENPGNQHFRGSGQFFAWPPGESKPVTPTLFSVSYFIPGDAIVYPLAIDPYPAPGPYLVEINLLANCGYETTYTQTVSVDLQTIAVSASPVAGGVVEGAESAYRGASVVVSATANSGYHFVNWTEGTAVVSLAAQYPFTVTANRALVANFRFGAEPAANIKLVTTVGIQAEGCASTSTITVLPAEKVYYCYSVTNGGNVTFSTHSLTDDKLGDLWTNFALELAPGQTVSTVQMGKTIGAEVVVTTTNIAIWRARSVEPDLVATTGAAATVYLGEGALALRGLDRLLPVSSGTEPLSAQMSYTLTVRNNGAASLKNVLLTFVVPIGARFLSEVEALPDSALGRFLPWDCPNNARAGTVCTLRIAVLSPGEEVLARTRLHILNPQSHAPLTVQFVASADGTRLVAGPTANLTVSAPQGVAEQSFVLFLPITLRAGRLLPPATNTAAVQSHPSVSR